MASLAVALAVIPTLPRPLLDRLTARMIERLDELAGDTDVEPNGDELDGTLGEDEFKRPGCNTGIWGGPGCPISEPDVGQDDFGEPDNEDYADEVYDTLPEYGSDQDAGPINTRQAYLTHENMLAGFERAQHRFWSSPPPSLDSYLHRETC